MDRVSKARTHLAPVVRMATSLGAAIRAAFDEQTLRPLGTQVFIHFVEDIDHEPSRSPDTLPAAGGP